MLLYDDNTFISWWNVYIAVTLGLKCVHAGIVTKALGWCLARAAVSAGWGESLRAGCSCHARTLHACAYIEVVLFPQPRGKMTGEEGAPAATTEVEKEDSQNGECVCARVCRLYWKRVRRVMLWLVGEGQKEKKRGEMQRKRNKESSNKRRAREWLQMGWDWQRGDGSMERGRE